MAEEETMQELRDALAGSEERTDRWVLNCEESVTVVNQKISVLWCLPDGDMDEGE